MSQSVNEIDPLVFRQTLSHYPTGVAVVAALGTDGEPVGLTVGSFTSVSLSPPLIGFFPARSSTSWPRIAEIGKFAVSVLSHTQRDLSRALSSTEGKKFASVSWHRSATDSPILDGALIWLDCVMHAVHDAGDHELVLGRVLDLGVLSSDQPLVFHRGSYVSYSALEVTAQRHPMRPPPGKSDASIGIPDGLVQDGRASPEGPAGGDRNLTGTGLSSTTRFPT